MSCNTPSSLMCVFPELAADQNAQSMPGLARSLSFRFHLSTSEVLEIKSAGYRGKCGWTTLTVRYHGGDCASFSPILRVTRRSPAGSDTIGSLRRTRLRRNPQTSLASSLSSCPISELTRPGKIQLIPCLECSPHV